MKSAMNLRRKIKCKLITSKGIIWGNRKKHNDQLFSECFYSSDGRVVRAYVSGAVDSVLIPSRVKPMTLKLVFTASLLDVQH